MKQITGVYTDELIQFRVRDISRLKPGTEIIFAHVPELKDPELGTYEVFAEARLYIVVEVAEKSFNDLHGSNSDTVRNNEKNTVILFEDTYRSQVKPNYRYATDAGVIPYSGNWYNDTNFTVIVSDLEDAGMTWIDEISPSYKTRLDAYNSLVTPLFDDYDYTF